MKLVILAVVLGACGSDPGAVDAAAPGFDAGTVDASGTDADLTFPIGRWNVKATPTAGCAEGSLVGGAQLLIERATSGEPLSVTVVSGLDMTVIGVHLNPPVTEIDAYEILTDGVTKASYSFMFYENIDELGGTELYGASCSLTISGNYFGTP